MFGLGPTPQPDPKICSDGRQNIKKAAKNRGKIPARLQCSYLGGNTRQKTVGIGYTAQEHTHISYRGENASLVNGCSALLYGICTYLIKFVILKHLFFEIHREDIQWLTGYLWHVQG